MHLLVVSSCTAKKRFKHPRGLTRGDFEQGPEHVTRREAELRDRLVPAEQLYTGLQHRRLLRGVSAFRRQHPGPETGHRLQLWILSAGYGLVPGGQPLAPYECSFAGMTRPALREWADQLGVPRDVRAVLSQPFDLGLVLLGEDYLEACTLDETVVLGGPTLLFCGSAAASALPKLHNLRPIVLTNKEATRFSCILVGLKGELAARLLELLAAHPAQIARFQDPGADVLECLAGIHAPRATGKGGRTESRPNSRVDHVIRIPDSWWDKPHRAKLRYFIPDWDDLVDPDYDFVTDTHSGGSPDWSNEVYAHQLYPEPNYDGILVSRAVEERNRKRKVLIHELGIHRFLRVPPQFPVLGDCGAFAYVAEEVPPYSTSDVLDYYSRLGFDYGVSVDHLTVVGDEKQKRYRYELTIQNAEDFIREHRARGLRWEPVGAVQGWDAATYAEAARQYCSMGYRYIALGSLVRAKTPEILGIVEEVRRVIPDSVRLHLLGLGRLESIRDFVECGVNSIDSASVLRKAWLGSRSNLLTTEGWYSAIRIPYSTGFHAKRIVRDGLRSIEEVRRLESFCLEGVWRYARGSSEPPSELVDALTEYDLLVVGKKAKKDPAKASARIRKTLEDRPWDNCGCAICRSTGVDVAIFRGNNRNRRRGFHNTYVFYKLIQKLVAGESIPWLNRGAKDQGRQLSLF